MRRIPNSAETRLPVGDAYEWYREVVHHVTLSGMHVAKQIARLCGDDTKVTVPWRSLTDAVGPRGTEHEQRAYTEYGARLLEERGWLRIETTGQKRGAKTTFYLVTVSDRELMAVSKKEPEVALSS
ncbi:hypothetical protein AB0J38_23445 [Streptomyces sp. NPDC050095]|uniref:hypothetical protein n=1 Tax=unclassified Streptomyces TaxID=2593676 RepID=UPI0034402D5C